MRIALCLYGNVGRDRADWRTGKPVDFRPCFYSLYHNVISPNSKSSSPDIFIHSWSIDREQDIADCYKPRLAVFETQRKFDCHFSSNNHTLYDADEIAKINDKALQSKIMNEFATRSRWYSNKQTLLLKSQYEKEHKFKYDWVAVLRFDIIFYGILNFELLNKSCFYAPTSKSPKVFKEIYNKMGVRSLPTPNDFIFVGTSEMMDKFAELIDHYDTYIRRYNTIDTLLLSMKHIHSIAGEQNFKKELPRCVMYRDWLAKHSG